jgi:hypothetical protein
MENLECHIFEEPDSQGSRRIVNSLVDCPGEGGKGRIGLKVSKKEASEFRCLTVKDIFELLDYSVEEVREGHVNILKNVD